MSTIIKDDAVAEKVCTACGKLLPLTEFYKAKAFKDGHAYQCKNCDKLKARAREYGLIVPRKRRNCACGAITVESHYQCQACHDADEQKKLEERVQTYKTCERCGEEKHRHAFPSDERSRDRKHKFCRLCYRSWVSEQKMPDPEAAGQVFIDLLAKSKAWREAHPDEYAALAEREWVWRKYGITPERYGYQLELQGGHCAICDRTPDMERYGVLSIDHDHSCCPAKGACALCFRSLSCFSHNVMMGNAHDNPEELMAAAILLENWQRSRQGLDPS